MNPHYYLLALIMHFVLIGALAVLAYRNDRLWRRLYLHLLVAFGPIAAGNLLLSVLIDQGVYYAGSFLDTPFFLSVVHLSRRIRTGAAAVRRSVSQP